jgi:hypothetical protein
MKIIGTGNMRPKISIHGSCVTRDLAEFHGYEVLHYQARSSLCTKSGQSIDYDSEKLTNIQSKFQRRMVEWDLKKKSFSSHNADCIIIDLIDERFDVYTNYSAHATRSQAFFQSGVLSTMKGNFVRVDRGSEDYFDLFRHGTQEFSNFIDRPVILHNARWASTYRQDGQVYDFENQEKIQFENELLDCLTEILTEEIGLERIIDSPMNSIADATHKWGLANFHYIPDYYSALDEQLINWFSGFKG